MHRLRSLPCALAVANLFFQTECREDPKFLQQVSALERMLRVKTRKDEAAVGAAATAGASAEIVGLREVHKLDGLDGATLAGAAVGGTSGLLLLPEVGGAVSADEAAVGAAVTAGASAGIVGLREAHKLDGLEGAKFAGAAFGGTSCCPTRAFTHVCSCCCECMWGGGKRLQFVVGHGN